MPKRGENIHKRKDGRWEGRYKIGRDAEGRIKYGSVYGKTYSEVKSKLTKVSQKKFSTTIKREKEWRFGEILLLWLETNHIKYKGATVCKYEYLIAKHIAPELGNIKVSELNALTINTFMNKKIQSGRLDKKGGLSQTYVRSIMLIINAALQFAINEDMCQPLNTPIYKPSAEKKELSILNIENQKKLESLLLCDTDRTKLGILISLHTGMRIGEVCALTWEDIDLKEKIIHVRSTIARVKDENDDPSQKTVLIIDKPKTKASLRDIPISSILIPILKDMKKQSCSKYVISDNQTFVSPRTYEYRYRKLLDVCGVASVNYHALRHTFATRCIEVGVDVKSLSEIMGHANVTITLNTYVHSSMELKRMQIEKLDNLICVNFNSGQNHGLYYG